MRSLQRRSFGMSIHPGWLTSFPRAGPWMWWPRSVPRPSASSPGAVAHLTPRSHTSQCGSVHPDSVRGAAPLLALQQRRAAPAAQWSCRRQLQQARSGSSVSSFGSAFPVKSTRRRVGPASFFPPCLFGQQGCQAHYGGSALNKTPASTRAMAAPAPLGAPSCLAIAPCLAGSKAVGLGTFGGHGGDAHGWEAKLEAVSICPNCSIFPRKTDQPLF